MSEYLGVIIELRVRKKLEDVLAAKSELFQVNVGCTVQPDGELHSGGFGFLLCLGYLVNKKLHEGFLALEEQSGLLDAGFGNRATFPVGKQF